jgi:hypothetical protein
MPCFSGNLLRTDSAYFLLPLPTVTHRALETRGEGDGMKKKKTMMTTRSSQYGPFLLPCLAGGG